MSIQGFIHLIYSSGSMQELHWLSKWRDFNESLDLPTKSHLECSWPDNMQLQQSWKVDIAQRDPLQAGSTLKDTVGAEREKNKSIFKSDEEFLTRSHPPKQGLQSWHRYAPPMCTASKTGKLWVQSCQKPALGAGAPPSEAAVSLCRCHPWCTQARPLPEDKPPRISYSETPDSYISK